MSTLAFCENPSAVRDFLVAGLGLEVGLDLGWFVGLMGGASAAPVDISLCNPHADAFRAIEGLPAAAALAFEVEGVAQETKKLSGLGAKVLKPPTERPWGQRNAYLQGPGGLVVELFEACPPDRNWLQEQGLLPAGQA